MSHVYPTLKCTYLKITSRFHAAKVKYSSINWIKRILFFHVFYFDAYMFILIPTASRVLVIKTANFFAESFFLSGCWLVFQQILDFLHLMNILWFRQSWNSYFQLNDNSLASYWFFQGEQNFVQWIHMNPEWLSISNSESKMKSLISLNAPSFLTINVPQVPVSKENGVATWF